MTNVLQVLSAARVWTLKDGTEHPTGFWAEEFGLPLKSKIVVDRNLYTGQNPGSSAALARRIIADVSGKEQPL